MKNTYDPTRYLSTEDFAAVVGVKADTVRRGYCTRGHYLGVKPLKLGNNRLRWPAVSPEELCLRERH